MNQTLGGKQLKAKRKLRKANEARESVNKSYPFDSQNVFLQIANCIWRIYKMYLSKFQNEKVVQKKSLPLIHKPEGLLGSSRVRASSIHYKVRAKIRANRASRFPCCVFHICSDKYKLKTMKILCKLRQIWPNPVQCN